MRGVRFIAVLVGVVIDFVGSVLIGVLMALAVVIFAARTGSVTMQHLLALKSNPVLEALGLVGTTLFTVVGGYVAARMSRPDGMKNALAVGLISLLLGLPLVLMQPSLTPAWKAAAGAIVTVPAALAGGWLARWPARLRA